MRKIFLLFVLLCTVASVSAVNPEWRLRVWTADGGLMKIPGTTIDDGKAKDLMFQATSDQNLFCIDIPEGVDIIDLENFILHKGDNGWDYKNTRDFYKDIFCNGSKAEFAEGDSRLIGKFKCYQIVLRINDMHIYFSSKRRPVPVIQTWTGGDLAKIQNGTEFDYNVNSKLFELKIKDGCGDITGTATNPGFLFREIIHGNIVKNYYKFETNVENAGNQWLKVSTSNGENIKLKAGTYYKLFFNYETKQFYASTIPPTAPAAFTVTPAVKQNATAGKNIFVGFDAKWTKVAHQTGYTINYTLTYKKDGLVQTQDLGDVDNVSLYGIDEGEVAIAAVYTNAQAGIVITSDPAKATYTATKVVNAVAIDAPTQLNRNAEGSAFSATLTWKAPETLPVSGYKVMQADATKGTPAESAYKLVLDANAANYQYTGMANIAISEAKGFTISNLTNNPNGVKVNYIVIPGYRIGNSAKTSISENDYNDDAISVVTYPAFSEITPATATFTNKTIATGVEGVETGKVAIYPNPTMGEINISGDEAINNVRLFTITGAIAGEFNGNGETTLSIDISNVPAGTYFLKVGTKVTKIIKK